MGIGTSLAVFAVGAILRFAVTITTTTGFNIHDVGIILMIVAAVGFVLSLFFWSSWGGPGHYRRESMTVRDPSTGVTTSRDEISQH